jgi:hypothetical protein
VWSFSNVLASQHSTSVDTPQIGRTCVAIFVRIERGVFQASSSHSSSSSSCSMSRPTCNNCRMTLPKSPFSLGLRRLNCANCVRRKRMQSKVPWISEHPRRTLLYLVCKVRVVVEKGRRQRAFYKSLWRLLARVADANDGFKIKCTGCGRTFLDACSNRPHRNILDL